MNPSREHETETLRSDIDVTRRRMDDTIDALGERMKPQHLADEVLGYFRRTDGNGDTRFSHMRDKLSQGTDAAVHAVVDTVKNNPIPALLIGAGVAWMIYNSRRDTTDSHATEDYYAGDNVGYDPDALIDRPLEYPAGTPGTGGISEAGWSDQGGSKLGNIKNGIGNTASAAKDKLAHAGEVARDKMGALRDAAGEKLSAVRHRAGELGSRVRARSGEMYSATRQRVATTADQHPLETGLVCLAAGVIAGLAVPTPSPVNRRLGPTADRLRERARASSQEIFEKGKRVASAAMDAAKHEAESQGLTPDRLRQQAGAIANRATEAGRDTARNEGLAGGQQGKSLPEGNQSGSNLNNPTVARPAV